MAAEATIVYEGGSEVVEGFAFIEELRESVDPYDMSDVDFQGKVAPLIRVWYSDPSEDDSDYVDYECGTITEVSP